MLALKRHSLNFYNIHGHVALAGLAVTADRVGLTVASDRSGRVRFRNWGLEI